MPFLCVFLCVVQSSVLDVRDWIDDVMDDYGNWMEQDEIIHLEEGDVVFMEDGSLQGEEEEEEEVRWEWHPEFVDMIGG